MRAHAYRWFEIVAWPAAAWAACELAIEAATGEWRDARGSLLLLAMSAAMVVAARWRANALRR